VLGGAEPATVTTGSRRTRKDPRRERTRGRLLEAARVIFERDGYFNCKLADITTEAGVSTGTLYNYYRSKQEIFRELIAEVVYDMADSVGYADMDGRRDPVQHLRETNRAYIQGYRRNARLISLVPQASEDSAEIRAQQLSLLGQNLDRVAEAIVRWQSEGIVHPDLDATYTAHALTFMTQRMALAAAVDQDGFEYDDERVIATVNRVWERTLGFDRRAQ
jgi:AcrR family transcriptional regulator